VRDVVQGDEVFFSGVRYIAEIVPQKPHEETYHQKHEHQIHSSDNIAYPDYEGDVSAINCLILSSAFIILNYGQHSLIEIHLGQPYKV